MEITFKPSPESIGTITGQTYEDIRVGPVDTNHGTTYRYMIGVYWSEHEYFNPASAWYDARRPQLITFSNRLTPDVEAIERERLAA